MLAVARFFFCLWQNSPLALDLHFCFGCIYPECSAQYSASCFCSEMGISVHLAFTNLISFFWSASLFNHSGRTRLSNLGKQTSVWIKWIKQSLYECTLKMFTFILTRKSKKCGFLKKWMKETKNKDVESCKRAVTLHTNHQTLRSILHKGHSKQN